MASVTQREAPVLLIPFWDEDVIPFIFTGFNGKIPQIGSAEFWYDCHGCGNATAYRPVKCRKCNCGSFDKRDPKGAARSFRYKRLRGVA